MATEQELAYWNRGVDLVPAMTGAATVMDGSDLVAAFDLLGVPLPLDGRVLDIGCGTGRLAQLCADQRRYLGLDVAAYAVAYARTLGLNAYLIEGPQHVHAYLTAPVELCCALSVFTHIPREERRGYLRAVWENAAEFVVDIIPGEEGGDVALWRANAEDFEADLAEVGWRVKARASRVSPDGVLHRYYRLV